MNQILMVENKKEKKKKRKSGNSAPADIKSIVRFFAIVIIIFGICVIGQASYAVYRDSKGNNTDDLAKISITRENDVLVVNVQSTYIIEKFNYNWAN